MALSLVMVIGACSANGDTDQANGSASTTTTSSPPPTSTTGVAPDDAKDEPGRALVTATSVEPLLAPLASTSSDSGSTLDALSPGDCVDLPGLGQPHTVEVEVATPANCDEPHNAEFFRVVSLNRDPAAEYPGDGAVLGAADQLCLEAFADYVGQQYVDSSLEIVHLRPDRAGWEHGERNVHCAVHARSLDPLTESVAGSGR